MKQPEGLGLCAIDTNITTIGWPVRSGDLQHCSGNGDGAQRTHGAKAFRPLFPIAGWAAGLSPLVRVVINHHFNLRALSTNLYCTGHGAVSE